MESYLGVPLPRFSFSRASVSDRFWMEEAWSLGPSNVPRGTWKCRMPNAKCQMRTIRRPGQCSTWNIHVPKAENQMADALDRMFHVEHSLSGTPRPLGEGGPDLSGPGEGSCPRTRCSTWNMPSITPLPRWERLGEDDAGPAPNVPRGTSTPQLDPGHFNVPRGTLAHTNINPPGYPQRNPMLPCVRLRFALFHTGLARN